MNPPKWMPTGRTIRLSIDSAARAKEGSVSVELNEKCANFGIEARKKSVVMCEKLKRLDLKTKPDRRKREGYF